MYYPPLSTAERGGTKHTGHKNRARSATTVAVVLFYARDDKAVTLDDCNSEAVDTVCGEPSCEEFPNGSQTTLLHLVNK